MLKILLARAVIVTFEILFQIDSSATVAPTSIWVGCGEITLSLSQVYLSVNFLSRIMLDSFVDSRIYINEIR